MKEKNLGLPPSEEDREDAARIIDNHRHNPFLHTGVIDDWNPTGRYNNLPYEIDAVLASLNKDIKSGDTVNIKHGFDKEDFNYNPNDPYIQKIIEIWRKRLESLGYSNDDYSIDINVIKYNCTLTFTIKKWKA